jgi:hypothetical protein
MCGEIAGTQIFSGGGECTLVKWDTSNPEVRRTLPRLGLPIRHVRGSPTNELIAVSHADNSEWCFIIVLHVLTDSDSNVKLNKNNNNFPQASS